MAKLNQLRRDAADAQRKTEQERLRQEDDDLWNTVKGSRSTSVIDLYLNQFPAGAHKAEAARLRAEMVAGESAEVRRQDAELSRSRDDAAWDLAHAANSKSAYQAYLKSFEKGLHAAEARELLAKIPEPLPPAPPPAPVVTPAPVMAGNPHPPYRNPLDKSEYVWVPGGTFQAGCRQNDTECGPDEPRRHDAKLPEAGFWIGQTETTVMAFKLFADATRRKMPPASDDNRKWQYTDHPMIKVSWQEAKEFCEWAGGRLPGGDEWERAARGGTDAIYPWGDEIQPTQAKYFKTPTRMTGAVTSPVKSFDPNGYGLFDVAGNVWEWTSDKGASGLYLARGGSWYSAAKSLRLTAVRTFKGNDGSNEAGFRCVLPQLPVKSAPLSHTNR